MTASRLCAGVIVAALSSCSGFIRSPTTELWLQEGPLAAANPNLVLPVTSKRTYNEGSMKFTLPDGAACTGTWSLTKGRVIKRKGDLAINPANLSSGSGTVVKDGNISTTGDGGTRVNHGNRIGQALGAGDCSNGATFRFSFMANGISAKGALRDSHGNLFRLIR